MALLQQALARARYSGAHGAVRVCGARYARRVPIARVMRVRPRAMLAAAMMGQRREDRG